MTNAAGLLLLLVLLVLLVLVLLVLLVLVLLSLLLIFSNVHAPPLSSQTAYIGARFRIYSSENLMFCFLIFSRAFCRVNERGRK